MRWRKRLKTSFLRVHRGFDREEPQNGQGTLNLFSSHAIWGLWVYLGWTLIVQSVLSAVVLSEDDPQRKPCRLATSKREESERQMIEQRVLHCECVFCLSIFCSPVAWQAQPFEMVSFLEFAITSITLKWLTQSRVPLQGTDLKVSEIGQPLASASGIGSHTLNHTAFGYDASDWVPTTCEPVWFGSNGW